LSRANLEGASLFDANLWCAELTGVRAARASLVSAHLGKAMAQEANFALSDCRSAYIQDADFTAAILTGANLGDATLLRTKLFGAKLARAILFNAAMHYVDLRHAELTGACLKSAQLRKAVFGATQVAEADLEHASFVGTMLGETDFCSAVSVDRIVHHGPSEVTNQTLRVAKGRLPEAFLRGCGLLDWEVENAKLCDPNLSPGEITNIQYRIWDLLAHGPIQIHPVFLSYAHADRDFVDLLSGQLDRLGIRYWRDIHDAPAGRMDRVIQDAITKNPTLLVVLSKNSVRRPWVEFEIATAVDLATTLGRDVLCPIMLDKDWLSDKSLSGNLRKQLEKYSVLDFSDWRTPEALEKKLKKLVEGLGVHYR
jgi:uncharacterized protein YjbI with pentapeptide repeats